MDFHEHGEELECARGHRRERIMRELSHHLPFSIFATLVSFLAAGVFDSLRHDRDPETLEKLFHLFLAAHILFSTLTTTAMFRRHDRSLLKACLIGVMGPVATCSLSDIGFPYMAGRLLGWPVHLHYCFFEEPGLVWPFVLVGVGAGLWAAEFVHKSTLFSHFGHILVSSMAALLYPLSFGLTFSASFGGWLFIVVLIAVLFPCFLSDIVFPLLFVKGNAASATVPAASSPEGGER